MTVLRIVDGKKVKQGLRLAELEREDALEASLIDEVARELGAIGDDDPCGELERLADRHRDQITRSRRRMAETRAAERNRVTAIEAEIARLKGEIAKAKEEATRKIAADKRLIATAKAALNIAEGGLE